MRILSCFIALSLFAIQPAFADSDRADYAVLLGGSPFGGSFTFAAHQSEKTTYQFSLGGLPGMTMKDQKIGDNDYDIDSSSSWVGGFISHRPIDSAQWFRLMAGVGFGNIENEITAANGDVYTANYVENPVGYLGLGFGGGTNKGFVWAFDLGWLQTAGPQVDGKEEAVVEDIKDHWMFGKVLPNMQLSLGYGF